MKINLGNSSGEWVKLSDGNTYSLVDAIKKLDADKTTRIPSKFCCYSRAMAQAMESRGFEIINVYTSKVTGKEVFQFSWTDEFDEAKNDYIESWKKHKAEQGDEASR